MIGVLVTDKNGSVQRRVYAGNDEKSMDIISAEVEKYPLLTFSIHTDSDPDWKSSFLDIQETKIVSKQQTDWQTAKAAGAQSAILFLAKALGLE